MANDLSFTQVATVLASLTNQATGKTVLTPTNTAEFVTVGQTLLKTGYDPILNALSVVLSRSIFSIRPYTEKFRGMEVSAEKYGGMVRKLKIADKNPSEDASFKWPVAYDSVGHPTNPSGYNESVDMFKLNKPDILQTNFYGQNVYSDWVSIFRDQIDIALQNPSEAAQLLSMIYTNISNRQNKWREEMARATCGNLIAAIIDENDSSRVFHALTEYNQETGLNLTATSVMQETNFGAFIRWLYARIANISDLMTEYSSMYQTNISGKIINQHCPKSSQRVYLHSRFMNMIDTVVKSTTFHNDFLKLADTESVNYWQSIKSPFSISITPTYTDANGAVKTGSAVTNDHVIGLICDRDAMAYSVINAWSAPTPVVANAGYHNLWYHNRIRNLTDNTEKAVVILLD